MISPSALTKQRINMTLRKVGEEGLFGIEVPARSLPSALEKLQIFPYDTSSEVYQSIALNLRRQQLIETIKTSERIKIQLSVKGIHRLQQTEIEELHIETPERWDHKWRLVLFDIPSPRKHERYLFVSQLKRLGFVMARQSTWFYPYPCFDTVDRIVKFCGLSTFVTYAEITRLDSATARKLLRSFPELS